MKKETTFNVIWRFLKEKIAMFAVFCTQIWDGWRLDTAIYMANALQKARNKQFYVIENAQGKLIWLCNTDIKEMKKPKKVRKLVNGKLRTWKFYMLNPNTRHADIMRDCLYYTPYDRNNREDNITVEERNQKRAKWLKYMEDIRMNRIFGKMKLK